MLNVKRFQLVEAWQSFLMIAVAFASPLVVAGAIYLASRQGGGALFVHVSHLAVITALTSPIAASALEQLIFRFSAVHAGGQIPRFRLRVLGVSLLPAMGISALYLYRNDLSEFIPAVVLLNLAQGAGLIWSTLLRLRSKPLLAMFMLGGWRFALIIWVLCAFFAPQRSILVINITSVIFASLFGIGAVSSYLSTARTRTEEYDLRTGLTILVGTASIAVLSTFERLGASFSGLDEVAFSQLVLFVSAAILPAGIISSALAFGKGVKYKDRNSTTGPALRDIAAYAFVGCMGALVWLWGLAFFDESFVADPWLIGLASVLVGSRIGYAPVSAYISAWGSIPGQKRLNIATIAIVLLGYLAVSFVGSSYAILAIATTLWVLRVLVARRLACISYDK